MTMDVRTGGGFVAVVSIDLDSRGRAETLSTKGVGLLMMPASCAIDKAVRAKSPVTLRKLETSELICGSELADVP